MKTKLAIACVCALVAVSTLAHAQATSCKKAETQPECHARLKCKADEELDACQKRLQSEAAAGQPRNDADNSNRDNRDNRDGRGDRDSDRGDRREREDSDNGRSDRDNDRGDRREREDSNRDRSDRRDDSSDRRSSRGSRSRSKGFQANKTFGLGLELGAPVGLNGKVFVAPALAIDFGLGFIYSHYYYGDGLHLYGDVLWHPISLVSAAAFELPFYVGVGLRYWDFDYCERGLCNYGGNAVGIRVPVGIAFDFNRAPLDIFIQLVPVLDFVNGDYYDRYRDRSHFGIDLSAGIRYWFK